jgi:Rrf2 family protein
MRLEVTRKSDLAVRALQTLAGSGERLKGPAIAEAVGSTAGYLSQVMTPLVRVGWVTSDPGPAGGYALAADLSTVSVLEVIEAIEGPTETGRCILKSRPCNLVGTCAMHVPWSQARGELLSRLATTMIAGLPPASD